MNAAPKRRKIQWIWLIIAIFFAKELWWSYLTPPWQAPDEIAHYGYVESLFYEKNFPVLGQTVLSERVQAIGPVETSKQIDTYRSSLSLNWIAQHPPLYYLILQPFYAFMPHGDPVMCIFLLRIFSILLGAATLYYAAKTFRLLLPDHELLQKTMVVGMAFLPMFSASSAAINNDTLVFALSAGLIYLSVKNFARHDTGGSVKMGILLGLLALTKATALPLFLSIFIVEIIKHFRRKSSSVCFLKHQLVIFGAALLIAGWWYTRNFLLYQMWLPEIGGLAVRQPWLLNTYPNLAKVFPESTGVIALPQANWFNFFIQENFFLEYFQNVWGAFGQFFFRLFSWQYLLVGAVFMASVCGYIKVLSSRIRAGKQQENIGAWQGWTMVLPFMIVLAAITWKLFEIYRARGFLGAMHGRYLFSAIIPMIYLLIRGVEHLMPQKHLKKALIGLMIFFVMNDGVTVLYRIIPEFY